MENIADIINEHKEDELVLVFADNNRVSFSRGIQGASFNDAGELRVLATDRKGNPNTSSRFYPGGIQEILDLKTGETIYKKHG